MMRPALIALAALLLPGDGGHEVRAGWLDGALSALGLPITPITSEVLP